jgi:flagellar hook assembly protein FlgD
VPQPVRTEAHVSFVLATASNATLAVHDPAGRLVRTLVNGSAAAGLNQLTWNGTDDGGKRLAPGMYFLQLTTPPGSASRRVLLLDP